MMKGAIVIVTYNRINSLKKNLQCIQNQTFKATEIYIIDNASTDGTREFLEEISHEWANLSVISLHENTGGAGGFYIGIQTAFENDADWVWGMDDDAYPVNDALEKIVEVAEKDKYRNVYWSNCDNDSVFECSVKSVSEWMFVGFFVTKRVFDKVGLPKKEYFIYHDDVEYAYRIKEFGFEILKVRDSVIIHKGNIETQYYEKRIGKRVIRYPALSKWKQYYYIRNYILRYSSNRRMKLKVIFVWMPWFCIKLFVLKPTLLPMFFKGYIHGVFGIAGIKERP